MRKPRRREAHHPGGNPGANLKSISHCYPILVAFVWELTKETIHLPLGCLQVGHASAQTPPPRGSRGDGGAGSWNRCSWRQVLLARSVRGRLGWRGRGLWRGDPWVAVHRDKLAVGDARENPRERDALAGGDGERREAEERGHVPCATSASVETYSGGRDWFASAS